MSAVASLVEDVVGGVVEAVGSVVEPVLDVVKDVGSAIDDYVIQPILDDPLTAIATVGAATFLGPEAAALFGTSGSVGVGIAAGAANTAAGLAQGEDFGTAIKGGLAAGVGAGVGSELFGGAGSETPQVSTPDPLDQLLAKNNNFADVPMDTFSPSTSGAPASANEFIPEAPSPLQQAAPVAETPPVETPSPLQQAAPVAETPPVETPSPLQQAAPNVNVPSPTDYSVSSNMQSGAPGLKAPSFTPADSLDIYGDPNYSLTPKGVSGGPGLQLPDSPNLASMGGGQGLTATVNGLPQYMENGVPTTFQGANGQTYGNPTPDSTISSSGATPLPQTITYEPTTNMGTPSILDQVTSGNFGDALKTAGGEAVDWIKGNPWTAAGAAIGATSLLGGSAPKSQAPAPAGSTQDKNFGK
jgi:hypothetical protein